MPRAHWSIRSNVIDQASDILVIGIGNTLRRDDGAGWFFAEALTAALRTAGQRVHLICVHQLTPELAVDAAELQPAAILFVDASVVVRTVALTPLSAPTPVASTSSGHALTPATLLTLIRRLYNVETAGWLVQTPGVDFGHGEGLSATAQRGVAAAPAVARLFGAHG